MDITALILGGALLSASAGFFAASLRVERIVDFLLAAYLLAWTEVVVVSLALSPARWLTRPGLLAGLGAIFPFALVVWQVRGRPHAPPVRPALRALREALRDPVLAVLGGAVVLALPYLVALALFVPPRDYDVFNYHLPRAAFWMQQHAVAYVPNVNELRINAFPPVAEIADAFTMILARSDRFTSCVQLGAFLAIMLAVFGIARRAGFGPRPALFGALLFATLPIAVLQAPTALNDVVLAGWIAVAAYFLLGGGALGLMLAALALALAIGTKPTAFYAVPVLAVVAAVAYPLRRWPLLLVTALAGFALGSFWYLVNRAETGKLAGGLVSSGKADAVDKEPVPLRITAEFLRRVVDAVDPSGSVGRDRFLYGIAAAVVLCVGAAVSLRGGSRNLRGAAVAAVLTAAALAVRPSQDLLDRAYRKALFELGHPVLAFLGLGRDGSQASSFQSWFGPLAVPLVLVSTVLVTREVRRRRLPGVALALALAPLAVLVVLAVVAGYEPWDGRWVMLAVPLGCATWGVVLPVRPLAWAAAAIAATTLALVLIHVYERPAGFNLLGGPAPRSIWTTSREDVMADYAPFIRVVDERVARSSSLGVRLGDEVSYPYFGGHLERRVVFVGEQGEGCDRARWLLVSPAKSLPPCRWRFARVAADEEGWKLYRRIER